MLIRRLHAEVTGALPGDRHREDPFGNRAPTRLTRCCEANGGSDVRAELVIRVRQRPSPRILGQSTAVPAAGKNGDRRGVAPQPSYDARPGLRFARITRPGWWRLVRRVLLLPVLAGHRSPRQPAFLMAVGVSRSRLARGCAESQAGRSLLGSGCCGAAAGQLTVYQRVLSGRGRSRTG
jgi:hypothetical protein